ncbi:MAG TPA: hypothetical protein VGM87_21085 [Roseomonas sp.]|jgi:hypothetical protein
MITTCRWMLVFGLGLAGAAQAADGRAAADAARFAGTYQGQLQSDGAPAPAETILEAGADGALHGRNSFLDNGADMPGTLSQCSVTALDVRCRWQDRYGEGSLTMHFDAAACGFRGEWTAAGRTGPRMFWNGNRHCERPGKPTT